MEDMSRATESSPYLEFNRHQWKRLRMSQPQVLTEAEVKELRGVGENIALDEVTEVYLPLSRLIHLQVEAHQRLGQATATFLGKMFRIFLSSLVSQDRSPSVNQRQRVCYRGCFNGGILILRLIWSQRTAFFIPLPS